MTVNFFVWSFLFVYLIDGNFSVLGNFIQFSGTYMYCHLRFNISRGHLYF